MNKKFVALATATASLVSAISFAPFLFASADNNNVRIMEALDRGTVAVKTNGGVYLSWRLLGTEDLSNQAFDIYRDGAKIHTTGVHDATCYTDADGAENNKYIIVPSGESIAGEKSVTPWTTNVAYSNGGFSNSVAYKDILFTAPSGGTTPDGGEYTYSANDMSTGDLDGDGEYEIIVKWDPSNSQDNSKTGYTGEVYMDAYKLDGTLLWRMNLGKNIRAGAHYTQYLVYDFDGDGQSEIIFKTAPGSKDGKGNFVSQAGKTDDIKNADDTADYRSSAGLVLEGPEWLTVFNGETGEAMDTVNYDPPRSIHTVIPDKGTSPWGDNYGNRCERYLAGVAYLDGVHPSLIMTRGYYTYAYAAAYTWDGKNLTEQWLSKNEPVGNGSASGCTVVYADGTKKQDKNKTLYAQGAHSLSVADVDNDGFDEIIFGSAVLDNDGTVLVYDGRGHGDAEHVSDFDNDGRQEIFFVHEAGKDNANTIDFAVDIKRNDGDVMLQAAVGDIGRGVMANIDDGYAAESGNLAAFWSTANGSSLFNQKGEAIGNIPSSNSNYENFFIYWDGDLGRELLDGNKLAKHNITHNSTTRIYYNRNNSAFPDVSSNNYSKANPGLVADILGDWREEVVYPLWNGTGMRIFFSTIPTNYRLATLMHDSQYRCAVAWQNVGYNQPPHTSYYIGSAALAKSGSTALNYLAPATAFDEITYPDAPERTPKPTLPPQPVSQALYERGTENYPISKADASNEEWTQTGNAQLQFDSENKRLLYNLDPTEACSASKTFKLNANANELIYDIDWCFGLSPNYTNYEYVQFGSNLRFGWNKDYKVYVSTDGGVNYSSAYVFSGANRINYTKNIKLTIDLETNTVKSVTFDNKELSDYSGIAITNPEQISFGIDYARKTGWDIPCGFSKLVVTENVPAPTPTPAPTASPSPSPTPSPTAAPTASPSPSPTATSTPSLATLPPSASPTICWPSPSPTAAPSATPSATPTASPSASPTSTPIAGAGYIESYNFENKYAVIHSNIDKDNVCVIFASYDGGRLTGIKTVNMKLEKGVTKNPMANDLENGETVKVFVWNSLNSPRPIMEAKEFRKD